MLKFSVKADGFDALQEKLAQACTKAEHIVATQVRKDTSQDRKSTRLNSSHRL